MTEIVPQSLRDPAIRTEFVKANGLRFEVDKCGDGDKLALCLHGFPEHSFSWRYQLPKLAELGYEAWAPNLRGYGNSDTPEGVSAYSIEYLMDDVAALIDASGAQETVLLAHDWGAVIAWFFAMRKKRPLQKLIICNVPHPQSLNQGFSWAQLKKSWYIFFFQLPGLPEYLFTRDNGKAMANMMRSSAIDKDRFPAEVGEVYRKNAMQPGGLTAMINYYRALLRGGGAKRQRVLGMPKITTPTLMIWGEEDQALTKETTYGTEAYVDELTIRYLPRVSHWVQQEQPEAVNAMIEAFIKGQAVPEFKWVAELVTEERK
jgi:pimeloyl-ACP methyl ester carboxylesterase